MVDNIKILALSNPVCTNMNLLACCKRGKCQIASNGEMVELLAKHATVESYAEQLCISPKYLTVISKKNSGKTATE